MRLEDYFDIVGDPPESIRLKGRRIALEDIVSLHKQHMTPEQIAVHFVCPISVEQAYAAVTYYLANRKLVDDYIGRTDAEGEALLKSYWEQPETLLMRKLREASESHQVSHS